MVVRKLTVAVLQATYGHDMEANIAKLRKAMEEAGK